MDAIKNRVDESGLIQLDLKDFTPQEVITEIDLTDVLFDGLVLRERDFREWIDRQDWQGFVGKAVFVHCSAEVIIPHWAYMLVSSKLTACGVEHCVGDKIQLYRELTRQRIARLQVDRFKDERIVIKGCADMLDPVYAMSELLKKLQPVARSIMYGEPCSAVPVFKRRATRM